MLRSPNLPVRTTALPRCHPLQIYYPLTFFSTSTPAQPLGRPRGTKSCPQVLVKTRVTSQPLCISRLTLFTFFPVAQPGLHRRHDRHPDVIFSCRPSLHGSDSKSVRPQNIPSNGPDSRGLMTLKKQRARWRTRSLP